MGSGGGSSGWAVDSRPELRQDLVDTAEAAIQEVAVAMASSAAADEVEEVACVDEEAAARLAIVPLRASMVREGLRGAGVLSPADRVEARRLALERVLTPALDRLRAGGGAAALGAIVAEKLAEVAREVSGVQLVVQRGIGGGRGGA